MYQEHTVYYIAKRPQIRDFCYVECSPIEISFWHFTRHLRLPHLAQTFHTIPKPCPGPSLRKISLQEPFPTLTQR